MTSFEERQVEWHKQEDARTVKVGEVRANLRKDIKKDADIKVSIDNLETLRFFCAVDLKKGDLIRITIEKV